jgi:hypothetical protein
VTLRFAAKRLQTIAAPNEELTAVQLSNKARITMLSSAEKRVTRN